MTNRPTSMSGKQVCLRNVGSMQLACHNNQVHVLLLPRLRQPWSPPCRIWQWMTDALQQSEGWRQINTQNKSGLSSVYIGWIFTVAFCVPILPCILCTHNAIFSVPRVKQCLVFIQPWQKTTTKLLMKICISTESAVNQIIFNEHTDRFYRQSYLQNWIITTKHLLCSFPDLRQHRTVSDPYSRAPVFSAMYYALMVVEDTQEQNLSICGAAWKSRQKEMLSVTWQ